MQALILAAGMGRRLGKHTDNKTKCMIRVAGKTLLEHTVDALKQAGIHRLVLVVGYEADSLIDFVESTIVDMEVTFVYNHDYATTNNIYSLYLAKEHLIERDTILLESDLIFEPEIIKNIVDYPHENVAVVAEYAYWMDGTVTVLDQDGYIKEFIEKKDFIYDHVHNYYKTVNIYKFSKEFSKNQYFPFLEAYITAYGKNEYYELVLKALAHLSKAKLKAYPLTKSKWYEIDDVEDLNIARTLFAKEQDLLSAYERHFGGYWRFDDLKDFCYFVNPYFPPTQMMNQIKYSFDSLLRSYPSGLTIQNILAAKMFEVDENYIVAGNGASELINTLGQFVKGTVTLTVPAFNEYIRCFPNNKIIEIPSIEDDFALNKNRLIEASKTTDATFIVNPDNPSGSFLNKKNMLEILDSCLKYDTLCVVDESFIDFAAEEERYTLLDDDILEAYPNLIVIKSIGKSYGVPGIRLGVMASSDTEFLNDFRKKMPIWNINSFGEHFFQIYRLYKPEYIDACNEIANQRNILNNKLKTISYLKVYESRANYIMCEVTDKYSSKELATQLLIESNLLIKNLSNKKGFDNQNFIRVAVKDFDENEQLYQGLLRLDN